MKTIKVKVDYSGEVKINGEYTTVAPCIIRWFPNNELVVETKYEKKTYLGNDDTILKFTTPEKKLEIIKNAKVQLAKNNIAHYVIVNDKFAFRLPSGFLD